MRDFFANGPLREVFGSAALLTLSLNAHGMERSTHPAPAPDAIHLAESATSGVYSGVATTGSPAVLCLTPDQAEASALKSGSVRLILSLETYTPPATDAGTITVTNVTADGVRTSEIAKIGLFPVSSFGPSDPPRQFFLPVEAANEIQADIPLCVSVSIGTEASTRPPAGTGKGEARFSLKSQKLE
ncbi:hypothetical protein SAMN05444272_0874 [Roseibium suaedae]|uniref:Uncharacterized protein n=1 Tax=Roseibium suaedae TaxID=735517 RepID=A0A1M7BKN1_9HYPH|nr:hypothetical protein SAMN05444272_0874 [Roseibium suaedae]